MKISGGIKDDGIVVGNAYDKYGSGNVIVKRIMKGFHRELADLVEKSGPKTIHEVGCGEGYWVTEWHKQGFDARGSDFSEKVIAIARENGANEGVSPKAFSPRSIYDMAPKQDSADLIVCCEVLEHLEDPRTALQALQKIVTKNLIISVPREPVWCALNLVRGKYISDFGNTPGHMQHWSSKSFVALVSEYFMVTEVRKPLPWTMLYCSRLE